MSRIEFRVTPEQHEAIRKRACATDVTVSRYLRDLALGAADDIIATPDQVRALSAAAAKVASTGNLLKMYLDAGGPLTTDVQAALSDLAVSSRLLKEWIAGSRGRR